MTSYKRGDVLLLPFLFTDLSTTKRRPTVVLSTDAYNARRADLITAPITSSVAHYQSDDCVLNDWAAAGLVKPSVVKAIIGTIEHNQVIRKLGSLSAADLRRVEDAIAAAIGLLAPP
jgi:mRNA interferase MazF